MKRKSLLILVLFIVIVMTISLFCIAGCEKKEDIEVHERDANSNYCKKCGQVMDDSVFTMELSSDNTYIVTKYNGQYTDIAIPSKYEGCEVKSIAEKAFANCTMLTNINIPDSITSIGAFAFAGCAGLKSITIPEGVTSIDDCAFVSCTSLTSVSIPSSVTSIDSEAFFVCDTLSRVDITDLSAWCNISFYDNKANPLFCAHNLYLNGELVTNLDIPSNVDSIGGYAFAGCTSLKSITLPKNITDIGRGTFYECHSLVIYSDAASEPSGWAKGNSLSNLSWNPNNRPVVWNRKDNDVADNGYKYIIDNGIRYAIKDNHAIVTSSVDSSASDIIVPTTITYKDKEYKVTGVDNYAFANTALITSVTLPDGITNIGEYAFYYCTALTNINMPSSVKDVGMFAFDGCDLLNRVDIQDIAAWCNISYESAKSNPLFHAKNLYLNGELVTNIEIPFGVISINYAAFSHCSSLVSITIPSSVTNIGAGALADCTALTSITIPSSVTNMGGFAFSGCTALESINIPSSVTSIGASAFADCSELTIYTEAASKPAGWDEKWNPNNRPVEWGYKIQ